ncbi:hypothetical protein AAHK20_06515 [Trinickia sp. YCB016]
MKLIKMPYLRALVGASFLTVLAACQLPPTVASNEASPEQRQAVIDALVKFGLEGDVSDATATGKFFNATFYLSDKYWGMLSQERTEWYRVHQNGSSVFTGKSQYTWRWVHGNRLQSADLTLYPDRAFCLSPSEISAAIPERYRGGEKLKKLVGIYPPAGESLKNSSMFIFTDDNACLKYVSFFSKAPDSVAQLHSPN